MIDPAKIVNQVICVFRGHKRIRKTVETETAVHKFSCKRCGCALDIGIWKNAPAPPGCSKEKWEDHKLDAINEYLKR